jgi:3-methyladenine DNA glycosylase AlkD
MKTNNLQKDIIKQLTSLGSKKRAEINSYFFKTGKGEYGEGDIFLGITMPVIRKQVKKYTDIPLTDTLSLLASKYHEIRMFALQVMVTKYKKATPAEKRIIFNSYLKNTKFINNWDLIDTSAEHIIGAHLFDKSRTKLYSLMKSKNLWNRRISILATFYFIRRSDFTDTITISKHLLNDTEDLMHKAVGWMLREVGKRNITILETYLREHYTTMPRTMLRYAIEKFPEKRRKAYLHGKV